MEKLLTLFKYIILSIIQGVGEILPISSSGHLLLFSKLFKIETNGMKLELILHLASLLALFIFYKKIIFKLIKGNYEYIFKRNKEYIKEYKFMIGMIIALVPTCLIGYFLNDYLDYFVSYSALVGIFLVLNGLNLYLVKNKNGSNNIEDLKTKSFIKIGLFQCLGLLPGFSRSGSCLSMCYREKLNKEDSEKFTFMMLFPLVIGSIILNIKDFNFITGETILLSISFIITFIVTLFSLKMLNKIINSNKLHYFSIYCLIIGILVMFIA